MGSSLFILKFLWKTDVPYLKERRNIFQFLVSLTKFFKEAKQKIANKALSNFFLSIVVEIDVLILDLIGKMVYFLYEVFFKGLLLRKLDYKCKVFYDQTKVYWSVF